MEPKEPNEIFASEWQVWQNSLQELANQATQLQIKLRNLSSEPEIRDLLEQKKKLKKRLHELEQKTKELESILNGRFLFLERRRQALTDRQLQQDFTDRVKRCKNRLKELKILNAPTAVTQNDERIIWEIQAPIHEVQKVFCEQNTAIEQDRQMLLEFCKKTQDGIFSIEDCYCNSKKYLEKTLKEIEERKNQCRAGQIEWGSSDHDHVRWILANKPLYRDDVLKRYKARFPNDDLTDLFPQLASAPAPIKNGAGGNRKKRRILLFIDEEKRHIKFAPLSRSEAYERND